jgi:hypothetical protein
MRSPEAAGRLSLGGCRRSLWVAASIVILIGACPRASVLVWSDPWGPHHPDEHILGLEALGLWEGITPREIGWPRSALEVVTTWIGK